MAEAPRQPRTDFAGNDKTRVRTGHVVSEIEPSSEWSTIEGTPGLSFRAWRFKDIDDRWADGAEIEIQPGYRTPVQHVVSETIFCEVPLSRLIFLSIDPDGKFSMEHFDPQRDDASYMVVARQGWTMCWFAPKDLPSAARVLEYEEPGFNTATLPTVPDGVTDFNGHKIPDIFWQTLEQLEKGTHTVIQDKKL